MKNKLEILVPDGTYHICNRANGTEKIFLDAENYRFFKSRFKIYISPIAEVYCYCLMPNHFHYVLRIRTENELKIFFKDKIKNYDLDKLLSKQFSNFLSSYSQAFNKVNFRKGSLFMKNFKRKRISDAIYFRNVIFYVHQNALQAQLTDKIENYNFSSYFSIVHNTEAADLLRENLISVFGDLENFKAFHENRSVGEDELDFISKTLE